jgi:formylglycine-generating enzyme required for sulfatase activity/serine/threonine protein kinase
MATPDEAKPPNDLLSDSMLREAPAVHGFKVLDPVVLYAKVGAGGMGAVYRGHHLNLDVEVAVKCLKPSLAAEDPDFVKRFEREARIAASIDHQNVVRVKDVREKNGLHYLVMDFVRGETARERVKRKGRLSEREALAILLGATAGLAAAHKSRIVHRDIKPDNIMVSLDGRVKLADLGLAKSHGSVDGRSVSMPASRIMGTPQYMPPEQWKSTDVPASADVWALGATFYFLVTGHSSLPGQRVGQPDLDYINELSQRVQNEDHPSLRTERPDLRPEVHALFERCVQRDPKDRFPDAQALLKELKKLAIDDDEDDVLLDPETGTGLARAGLVTPPPRQTLLRIRAQVGPSVVGRETEPEPPEPAGGVASKSEGNTIPSPVPVPERTASRSPLLLVLLVLLLAVGGVGYAAGWFQPAAPGKQGNESARTDEPVQPPKVAPQPVVEPKPTVTPADTKAEARAALAKGKQLLPQKGQLDAAITALEDALQLDAELTDVKVPLAGALAQKAKDVGDSDLDAAFTLCARAAEMKPGDAALLAQHDELRSKLAVRLAAGLAIKTPTASTYLTSRQVLLEGSADSPNLRAVRFALVPGNTAPATFPSACAEASVISGVWSGLGRFADDGEHVLCVEAEDGNGVKAQLATPVSVIVDTQDPVLLVEQPSSNGTVGVNVAVGGKVTDALACTVTVSGQPAKVDGERWSLELTFRDGAQELLVEAKDAAGRSAVPVTRSFVVDAVAPVLTLAALPKVTKDAQVTVSGKVKDLGTGELRVDGKVVTPGADGSFAVPVPLGSDQTYTIEVEAKDLCGNRSSEQVEIRRDTKGPVLEWISPDTSRPVRAGLVEVSGFVTDESAIKSVMVNDQPAAMRGSGWTAKVMVRAASGGKATPPTQINVVATDALGNSSEPLVQQLQLAVPITARISVDFEVITSAGTGFEGLPKRIRHLATGIEFLLIPPGVFDMGSPQEQEERRDDETLHRVTLTEPFYLAETEVSVAQWRRYQQATGYKTEAEVSGKGGRTWVMRERDNSDPDYGPLPALVSLPEAVWTNPLPYWSERKWFQADDNHPVTHISWNDAMAFCRYHNMQLPTEAQWEYSCRAGQSARYWWGDAEEQGLGKINGAGGSGEGPRIHFGSTGNFDDGFKFTAPVNRNVTPNAFGLKDMLGNVLEWCADCADYSHGTPLYNYRDSMVLTDTYAGAVADPLCLVGPHRVFRGGCWKFAPKSCRSALRGCNVPWNASADLGFRPALIVSASIK